MHRLNHQAAWRTSSLPLIAVALGTVGIMAGIFLGWYLANYRYVEIRTPDGKVVFADRLTKRQAEKIRQDELDKYEQRMAEIEATVAKRAEASGKTPTHPTEARATGTTDNPEPTGIEFRIAEHSDPKIRIVTNHRKLSGEGRGLIVGNLLSGHGETLRSVEIAAELFDAENKKLKTLTTTRLHVPAKRPTGFVLVYEGVPAGDIAAIVIDAVANQATRLDIALKVSRKDCEMNIDGGTVVITGRVRNTTPTAIRQVEVHCDFMAAHGVYLGSARGEIEDGLTELAPGEWAFFTAKFAPSVVGRIGQAVEDFSAVLIGRK